MPWAINTYAPLYVVHNCLCKLYQLKGLLRHLASQSNLVIQTNNQVIWTKLLPKSYNFTKLMCIFVLECICEIMIQMKRFTVPNLFIDKRNLLKEGTRFCQVYARLSSESPRQPETLIPFHKRQSTAIENSDENYNLKHFADTSPLYIRMET